MQGSTSPAKKGCRPLPADRILATSRGRGPGPPPVGRLQGEQPRARALGRDPCTLGRDLLVGRIGQVSHRLPTDRRVRSKQPPYDRTRWLRGLPFGWIGRHLLVLLPVVKRRCWWPHSYDTNFVSP